MHVKIVLKAMRSLPMGNMKFKCHVFVWVDSGKPIKDLLPREGDRLWTSDINGHSVRFFCQG